jgi:hypothetical protein
MCFLLQPETAYVPILLGNEPRTDIQPTNTRRIGFRLRGPNACIYQIPNNDLATVVYPSICILEEGCGIETPVPARGSWWRDAREGSLVLGVIGVLYQCHLGKVERRKRKILVLYT